MCDLCLLRLVRGFIPCSLFRRWSFALKLVFICMSRQYWAKHSFINRIIAFHVAPESPPVAAYCTCLHLEVVTKYSSASFAHGSNRGSNGIGRP